MDAHDKPIGEIVLVGRSGYQIYSHSYRGNVEYRADIGKPWTHVKTGVTKILSFMQADSTRDFREASERAAKELEELRNADFRQDVHKKNASITPLADTKAELEFDGESPLELKLASG